MRARPTFTPQKPTWIYFSVSFHVGVRLHGPQAEDHHRQRQHAKDAEHGGVSVVGSERRADLEVGDDGQVDQEAEDSRAHEVPDAHGHQEIDGPLLPAGNVVPARRALPVLQLDEVPGVQGQQRQRHHLQRGEAGRQAHVERPLAGEVPVVARADDPAAEVQDGVQVDQARGGLGGDQAHLVEHDRHQHRREELEESLDPEVDDPEAPVVDDGEVGVRAVEERGQVEDRDGHGRV